MRLPYILRSKGFKGILIAIVVALQILFFSFLQPANSQVLEAVAILQVLARTGMDRGICYTGAYMGGNECRKPSRCVEAVERFENVVKSNGSSSSIRGVEQWIGSASQNKNCAIAIAGGPFVSAVRNAVKELDIGRNNPIPGSPSNANSLATGEYYRKRVGEHCEWLLTHTGLTPEWQLIQSSAQKDAGNTNSEYYRNRIAEHCRWLLSNTNRTDKWNLIEDSARKDAGIPLVSR